MALQRPLAFVHLLLRAIPLSFQEKPGAPESLYEDDTIQAVNCGLILVSGEQNGCKYTRCRKNCQVLFFGWLRMASGARCKKKIGEGAIGRMVLPATGIAVLGCLAITAYVRRSSPRQKTLDKQVIAVFIEKRVISLSERD